MIQEGLVYRLSNIKNNTAMDIRMDIEKTIKMITKSSGEPKIKDGSFQDINQNDLYTIIYTLESMSNELSTNGR